jgi:hypothetical protein
MPGNKEKAAGSVAMFNHTDISRSDAEKIQCWTRLVRAAAAEKFQMLLVTVLFTENIDVSDGFWGLTKNSAFKLWYENNVELYKTVNVSHTTKEKEW